MIEVRPTEELNAWQVYRQAKSLAKHTSRAHNPDWYRGALDLDRQWHIWFDGQRAVSAVFDRVSSGWTTGPQPILPHPREMHGGGEKGAAFDDGSLRALHETLHQLIQGRELGGKAKSLGVVIHLADEFSISEISPEYAIDEDFNAVAALLEADPMEAIGDANLDLRAHSWRLLPYWGVREGERRAVAVQTGRALQPLVEELRKYGETRNVPVIATCVSAPIEALRMGPFFIDANEDQRKGNIFVFLYQRFSLLAVCDSQGELVQARALQHRAGQTYPAGLGDTLVNTAAAVNLEEPHVHLVAMAEVNAEGLSAELSAFFASRPPMNIGLVNAREIEEFRALPGNCAEMALGDPQITSRLEQHAPLLESVSFRNLAAGWAIQDFATRLGEVAVNYPSLKDLKLLRAFGMLKFLLVAVVVGVGAWTGLDLFRTMTTDAWKLPEDKASTASAELEKLKQEKGRVEYWENLMKRRSEGWLAMEVLLDLFPPESGLVISDCDYAVEGAVVNEKRSGGMPFQRKWIIRGYARAEGLGLLTKLGSNTYLAERFAALAENYKAESLENVGETRYFDVTMQQRQSQMPAGGRYPSTVARHYRTSFELTITQNFSERDPLALVAKPPSMASAEPDKKKK